MFETKELGCDYYYNNASDDNIIPDQEERRRLEDAQFLREQEESMLSEIDLEARVDDIALEINIIKRQTAETCVEICTRSSIQIGQLLKEAKVAVGHGNFEKWLRENVDYSISTAQRFMKLADTYAGQLEAGDEDVVSEVIASMLPSKALVLARLQPQQRKEFIEEHDVEDMSVREMEAAIKAKAEAEQRAIDAEQRKAEAEKAASEQKQQAEELAEQLAAAEKALEDIKQQPVSEDEMKRIEEEMQARFKAQADKKVIDITKKAEKDLQEAKKQGAEAVQRVEESKAAAINAAVEEAKKAAREEAANEIEALKDKLKATVVASSPYRAQFKAYMEAFQADYGRMLAVVEKAEQEQPDIGAELKGILDQILDHLK